MQQQKSRAFYRIQATRMMIGAGNILKKHAADQARKVRHARRSLVTISPDPQLLDQVAPETVRVIFFVCFQVVSSNETQAQEDDPHTTRMEFEPSLYQCFENCGSLKLTVSRHGGEPGVTVKVRSREMKGTWLGINLYVFAWRELEVERETISCIARSFVWRHVSHIKVSSADGLSTCVVSN